MAKEFNIHDWQAKQRKKLFEGDIETWNSPSGEKHRIDHDKQDISGKPIKTDEHHAGEYEPDFLKQTVNTFLDKLKKKTDEGPDYKTVEKIMEKHFAAKKEVDEMNTTGGGASFNAGSGEGYMTPKAFKKKNKKD